MTEVPKEVIEIIESNLRSPFIGYRNDRLNELKGKVDKAVKEYEEEKEFIAESERQIQPIKDWLNTVKPKQEINEPSK